MTRGETAAGAGTPSGQKISTCDSNFTAINAFRDAIAAAGLTPPEKIEADGRLHRFSSNGKRDDDAGWYVFHADGIPAGRFGCWRTSIDRPWRYANGHGPSPEQDAEHRARVEQMRRARDAEQARQHEAGAEVAQRIWDAADPAEPAHPYLARKGISPSIARQIDAAEARRLGARLADEMAGALLAVPRMLDGKMASLEFIAPDGVKRSLAGARAAGTRCLIGGRAEVEEHGAVIIAEGFATAASIREAAGVPVCVAFSAGNLLPVAIGLRSQFPSARIVIAADDDASGVGQRAAEAAARAVGGLVAVPDFGADRPSGLTDFNDLSQHAGPAAVRACIERAAPPTHQFSDVPDVPHVQPAPEANLGGTAGGTADVPDVPRGALPDVSVPLTDRPKFAVYDEPHRLAENGQHLRAGVWFHAWKPGKKDEEPTLIDQWVASPLHVEAVTHDAAGNNFGRLLRFIDTNGRERQWAMPMEMLAGDGAPLRAELLSMGALIDPAGQRLFGNYLQALTPAARVRCALQVGWCGRNFVLPDGVIGPEPTGVIFQSGERFHEEHGTAGTPEGWRAGVAALAAGNPMIVLALSVAFAGPLLAKCSAEGGGIHLVGDSSTGKTTALNAACSVWGGPSYRRSWRSTANGMEGAAVLFNDALLALDEISECEPRDVGLIVYALGNGRGKQRASRSGAARGVARWRCAVLSSGERTIGTHMAEAGQRAKAGQQVRLLDVPTARKFGAFDDLRDTASGAALADAIRAAGAEHYGHAGRQFLERLTRDERDFGKFAARIKALPEFNPEGAEGQDKRAAARFALFAQAGELATEYGITGWAEGEAIRAAAEGFRAWRALRGKGNDERRQILEAVGRFIQRHGDSRFSCADMREPVRDRAGWWREDAGGGRVFLFNADGLREALKGFDFKRALDVLGQAGALPPASASGERAKPQRVDGIKARLYEVRADALDTGDGDGT
jgi:putative DNA primase/helicase